MKPNFRSGRGGVPRLLLASLLAVSALAQGQNRDALAEARAVLAQKRNEEAPPTRWSKLTNRSESSFQQMRTEKDGTQAPVTKGPSPYNPKFGAPAFQMPSTPGQDAEAPKLTQFHPTAEPGEEGKEKKFLDRGSKLEKEETPGAEGEDGRKSTLSYSGQASTQERLRTYDEIYQSKSPYALPTFEMPSGPAAAMAAPGAQTWGGRVLTQYQPEAPSGGLDRARMEREQRLGEREMRRNDESGGRLDVFNRTKRLESR